jgi:hypothetical protein
MAAYYTQGYGDAEANTAKPQLSAEEKSMRRLLTASGVPNDNGQLRWPLGLTILAAPGADELSEQIEALFEEAASQAAAGSVSPVLAEEARQAVQKLRKLLLKEKAERFGMPLALYRESERFLARLERAALFLRAGMGRPSEQQPVKTESYSTPGSTGSRK